MSYPARAEGLVNMDKFVFGHILDNRKRISPILKRCLLQQITKLICFPKLVHFRKCNVLSDLHSNRFSLLISFSFVSICFVYLLFVCFLFLFAFCLFVVVILFLFCFCFCLLCGRRSLQLSSAEKFNTQKFLISTALLCRFHPDCLKRLCVLNSTNPVC